MIAVEGARVEARPPRPATESVRKAAVARALAFIRSAYGEPISLDRLSREAMLSRFHLHRVFTEATGVPPGRFIAAVRMESAKRLLVHSSMRVTDICYEVGYRSLGTFTFQFASLVGMPPRRFRVLARRYGGQTLDLDRFVTRAFGEGDVAGRIFAEPGYSGWACIGTFRSRLPEGIPTSCAVARVPGFYALRPPSSTAAHLLALAVPEPRRVLDLLLPPQSDIRVGWLPPSGPADVDRSLHLRPLRPVDPPVVLATPLLLVVAGQPAGPRDQLRNVGEVSA